MNVKRKFEQPYERPEQSRNRDTGIACQGGCGRVIPWPPEADGICTFFCPLCAISHATQGERAPMPEVRNVLAKFSGRVDSRAAFMRASEEKKDLAERKADQLSRAQQAGVLPKKEER